MQSFIEIGHLFLSYFADKQINRQTNAGRNTGWRKKRPELSYGIRQQSNKKLINKKHMFNDVDVDVDGVYERRPKPLCPHLEITLR